MSRPLLSICVPTWNRAALLDLALETVVPQTELAAGLVECVVSDNGSTDHTESVVARYAGCESVRYFRNDANLGAVRNCSLLFSKRARGEFVWFLGDDDALTAGAVSRVVDVLQSHGSEIDFIGVNYLAEDASQRPTVAQARGGVPPTGDLVRPSTREGRQPFESLLDGEGQAFTPVYSFVTRREHMSRAYSQHVLEAPPYESVEASYPHAVMLATTMVGRPAYHIADPMMTVYRWPVSAYSWARYVPLVGTVRYAEVLRLYLDNGVPLAQLRPYFREVVSNARGLLSRVLWDEESAGGAGSIRRLFAVMPCYRRELMAILFDALRNDLAPRPVRRTTQLLFALASGARARF